MSVDGRSEDQDLHDAYAEGEVHLAFGRGADGRVLHISEVVSGLACACVCPACADQLVAKRSERKEHPFAHHVVGACRYGPGYCIDEHTLETCPSLLDGASSRR